VAEDDADPLVSWRQRNRLAALAGAYRGIAEEDRLSLKGGGQELTVRGPALVLVVIMLSCFGVLGWMMTRGFDSVHSAITRSDRMRMAEHQAIVVGLDRFACLQTMNDIDRKRFREEYRHGAFERWCAWIKERSEFSAP